MGKALILGEDGDASGTSRIQSCACYRIGDCGADTVGETHGDGMAGIGLSGFTGGVERGGDDDDARDEFNGDGQSDAEGHAIVAERGIGDGILVKTVNDRRQPDFQRYLLGCRQQEADGGACADTTQHLNDNIEHSVKHMGFAGQHRRNGDRRIELGAGNRAEYQGGGGVHQTCQQGDERHIHAVDRGTKRANRVDGEADDEASHQLRAYAKGQWLALFFLCYGRCFNSSHSLSSVI